MELKLWNVHTIHAKWHLIPWQILDIPLPVSFSTSHPTRCPFQVISILLGAAFKKKWPTKCWQVPYIKLPPHPPPLSPSHLFHKRVSRLGLAQHRYSVAGVDWEVFFNISGSLDLSSGHTYSVLMMNNVHTSALIQTWSLPEFEICMDKVCADGLEF